MPRSVKISQTEQRYFRPSFQHEKHLRDTFPLYPPCQTPSKMSCVLLSRASNAHPANESIPYRHEKVVLSGTPASLQPPKTADTPQQCARYYHGSPRHTTSQPSHTIPLTSFAQVPPAARGRVTISIKHHFGTFRKHSCPASFTVREPASTCVSIAWYLKVSPAAHPTEQHTTHHRR